MTSPFLLPLLITLPFTVGGVIVVVSSLRRRRHVLADGSVLAPVHRLQADPATVQAAAVPTASRPQALSSGRERRAAEAVAPKRR